MLPDLWRARPRAVTPEPLNVAPELIGLPLASPARRGGAMAVDLVVVALLFSLADVWLALGLLAVVFQLRPARNEAGPWRRAALWLLVAVFVGFAARAAWTSFSDRGASAPEDRYAAALAEARAVGAGAPETERIALLEQALADALTPDPPSLREQLAAVLEDLGASFGWGIVYFSLLPAWWGGQTIGKRLFGLQVVELTGQPITVMRSLKRYGGYAAGMATGGLGFAQMLWDPNRQALQDRTAHTVVLDRRPSRSPRGTPGPAPGPGASDRA